MLISAANAWVIEMLDKCTELLDSDFLGPSEKEFHKGRILEVLDQADRCTSFYEIWSLAVNDKWFAMTLGGIFTQGM